MLIRIFMVFAKLLLFVAVVWLVVMAYWKYTDHVVSSADLLIYFLILPVALLLAYLLFRGVWWGSRKTFRRFNAPAIAPVSTTVAAGGSVAGSPIKTNPPVYVIATAMSTYFGDEGTRFLDAMLQDNARAEIDPEFTQEMGYGVRVARVASLELATIPEGVRTTMVRTHALLVKVYSLLENVLSRAAPSAEAVGVLDQQPLGVQLHPEWHQKPGVSTVAPTTVGLEGIPGAMPANLIVHIVLPAFITAPELNLLKTDVEAWLLTTGWPKHSVKVVAIQAETDVDYLQRLQAWLTPAPSGTLAAEWLLILSAASWLDIELLNDRLIKDSQFADRLARGGAVVGELACGMVLAKTRPAAQLQLDPVARLSPITLAQRNKPVDAKGAIAAELLTEMLTDQISVLAEHDKQFVGLTASGDLNNGRAIELGKWVTDSLPQLDFIEDVLCVAEHIGQCEPAGNLLALTLAAAMAEQREGPVLYCANQHASWRALAVLLPANENPNN